MPLIFSPLSDEVVNRPPPKLIPKSAFIMRQIGSPPAIDAAMDGVVRAQLQHAGYTSIDATSTSTGKDYLERIIGLIRATGFTVAIFSEETRPSTMANIALELGFAAMSGKSLVICKSKQATAPSDLKRTDWIEYDPAAPGSFTANLKAALGDLPALATLERTLLDVALEARATDCAVALERCNRGFLLSGEKSFIDSAERLLKRVEDHADGGTIHDLERLKAEIKTFIRQANEAVPAKRRVR